MASIRKENGRWRVQVSRDGRRRSKNCRTRGEAEHWAREFERLLAAPEAGIQTLGDAFKRFREKITPKRKGAKWEGNRLRALEATELASVRLSRLTPAHLAEYRDRRLEGVKGATVRRELNLIESVLEHARRDWGWIQVNPIKDVKRPLGSKPRDRRISEDEIERLLLCLGYESGPPQNTQQTVAVVFLIALETGMRLGEIVSITRDNIFPHHVHLKDTKNDDKRDVPLSTRAKELVAYAPFEVSRDVASVTFSRAVKNCQIENLRFHDSRHEAITRLSKKLELMELARMVGVRDLRTLMIYYNEAAAELAKKLD